MCKAVRLTRGPSVTAARLWPPGPADSGASMAERQGPEKTDRKETSEMPGLPAIEG